MSRRENRRNRASTRQLAQKVEIRQSRQTPHRKFAAVSNK